MCFNREMNQALKLIAGWRGLYRGRFILQSRNSTPKVLARPSQEGRGCPKSGSAFRLPQMSLEMCASFQPQDTSRLTVGVVLFAPVPLPFVPPPLLPPVALTWLLL